MGSPYRTAEYVERPPNKCRTCETTFEVKYVCRVYLCCKCLADKILSRHMSGAFAAAMGRVLTLYGEPLPDWARAWALEDR